jgi:ferredoxin
MPKSPYRPYTPNPDFLAKLPEGYSGNAVNGLGEYSVRPPTMVWWTPDMQGSSFGAAQQWFYEHEVPDDEMLALRKERHEIVGAPLPDVTGSPAERSPEDWTSALDAFVEAGDCEMVGVTRLQPEWVFDHEHTTFGTVLIFGVQHIYDKLKHVPALEGGKDVTRQYGRAAAVSMKVAAWLRLQGWDADPVTGPMTGKILMIPPALECGFGELGKHGSLINPEFGSAFRLGAVLTDAPFAVTPKRVFGVDDFCQSCRICEDACPPLAIVPDKQTVRGEEKWYVDFDKCIPFFAESSGCAICIAVCPWSRPGVGESLASKLARRAERLAQQDS